MSTHSMYDVSSYGGGRGGRGTRGIGGGEKRGKPEKVTATYLTYDMILHLIGSLFK